MNDTERLDWLEEAQGNRYLPGVIGNDMGKWTVSFEGRSEGRMKYIAIYEPVVGWYDTIREAVDAAKSYIEMYEQNRR